VKPFVSAAITFLLFAVAALATPLRAAQAPNAPGSFLDVDGGKLYYEECGTGPEAVLLVHDGVLHSAVWDDVWPTFCKNFHTIRYDRRGYGRSPATAKWYSETDDMYALLRHLKINRTMVVGSSHGGELSIEFTIEHPSVVEELVLVGAVVHGYPYSAHFLERGQALAKPLEKNDIAGTISNGVNDKYLTASDHPEARKKMRDLLTASPQDMTHSDLPLDFPSSVPRLHEIRVPTLILVGDIDIPDVHAHAGVIEAGIPNARRIVVSDAGHLMYLEKPEEFSRIVIDFLQAHRE
jgi:3-oxoadipate enol-lactonase